MKMMNKGGVPVDKIHYWPRIIAFSGKYGTGKDSAADAVLKHIHHAGFKTLHLKFASAVKTSAALMTGMPMADQFSAEGKCKTIPGLDMTVARFQQLHGTVAREHIHPDIWVVPVVQQCRSGSPDTVYIISDCRFPNEVKAIHELGGVVIRLNRRADLIGPASTAGRDPTHVSETALDDCTEFDLVIENHGMNHEHIPQVLAYIS